MSKKAMKAKGANDVISIRYSDAERSRQAADIGAEPPILPHLSRPIWIHICRDGTISYRDRSKGEPVFNGVALPVFSVNTVEEAKDIQLCLGRKQYIDHPDKDGMAWYKICRLGDGTDPASRIDGLLVPGDLQGITRMLKEWWDNGRKWKPIFDRNKH